MENHHHNPSPTFGTMSPLCHLPFAFYICCPFFTWTKKTFHDVSRHWEHVPESNNAAWPHSTGPTSTNVHSRVHCAPINWVDTATYSGFSQPHPRWSPTRHFLISDVSARYLSRLSGQFVLIQHSTDRTSQKHTHTQHPPKPSVRVLKYNRGAAEPQRRTWVVQHVLPPCQVVINRIDSKLNAKYVRRCPNEV